VAVACDVLQDKLHQNLCRQRSLVAIGTHDLAKLQPPFTYEACLPGKISFVPLKQTREFKADELLEVCSPQAPQSARARNSLPRRCPAGPSRQVSASLPGVPPRRRSCTRRVASQSSSHREPRSCAVPGHTAEQWPCQVPQLWECPRATRVSEFALLRVCRGATEMNRICLVLFDMKNRMFGPYLAVTGRSRR
jgi:hypothetical protein